MSFGHVLCGLGQPFVELIESNMKDMNIGIFLEINFMLIMTEMNRFSVNLICNASKTGHKKCR